MEWILNIMFVNYIKCNITWKHYEYGLKIKQQIWENFE